jgi:hypothetical protein
VFKDGIRGKIRRRRRSKRQQGRTDGLVWPFPALGWHHVPISGMNMFGKCNASGQIQYIECSWLDSLMRWIPMKPISGIYFGKASESENQT